MLRDTRGLFDCLVLALGFMLGVGFTVVSSGCAVEFPPSLWDDWYAGDHCSSLQHGIAMGLYSAAKDKGEEEVAEYSQTDFDIACTSALTGTVYDISEEFAPASALHFNSSCWLDGDRSHDPDDTCELYFTVK